MSSFFAYLSRLRYIKRWSLMRNTSQENVQEHSLQVAHIAHALASIRNARYGGGADPARAAELAIFHEAGEVMTGDLATPIKYFSPDLTQAYKRVERIATGKMMAMLPEDLRETYVSLLLTPEQDPEWPRVKAADRICAYLKCVEEERAGNQEFTYAKESILRNIEKSDLGEVGDFMREFVPAYSMTLDELNK
jgi:5'-deoxynucleotidase